MNLISVIVPVFNVEQYLNRCLESIVNQTYTNLEIILVDDGSTDKSGEICDYWKDTDQRIKVIHKENGGLSDARNVGMNMASGEYIGFIDSDDYIAPEMYDRLLKAIIQNDSDIAVCSVEMVWENQNLKTPYTSKINDILDNKEAIEELIKENKLKLPVWNRLYKSCIAKKFDFPYGKFHEDILWSYQVFGSAERVSIIDYTGYYYMQRDNSIMGEGYSIKRLDALDALEERQAYIEEYYPEFQYMGKRSLWFSCLYHGQHAIMCLQGEELLETIEHIKTILKDHNLEKKDFKKLKLSHRIWFTGCKISFAGTCLIRNILKIGL